MNQFQLPGWAVHVLGLVGFLLVNLIGDKTLTDMMPVWSVHLLTIAVSGLAYLGITQVQATPPPPPAGHP